MKEIKAIIQPFLEGKVLRALASSAGLPGVTVSQVVGWGKGLSDEGLGTLVEPRTTFSKKTKLEIVIPETLLDVVLNAVAQAAHTGNVGHGKIFVYEVQDVVKIRTGERGEAAI